MSTTYITNPPSATPIVTVVPANEAPSPLPSGGAHIPAWPNFQGQPVQPTNQLVTQFIAAYQGQATVPATTGTGGAEANQVAIDTFNQAALNYQAQQKAAWDAAGDPPIFTPTAAPPVASPVPVGPCTVIMDPSGDGSGWVYPATTGPLAGVCPPFVPPAPPAGVPYINGFLGLAKSRNGQFAVFSLVAGLDTVTQADPETSLIIGETYGLYTYTGVLGSVQGPTILNVTKQLGEFGASYYYSDPL